MEDSGTYIGRIRDWPSTKLTPIHARSSWWPKVSTIVGWIVATFIEACQNTGVRKVGTT